MSVGYLSSDGFKYHNYPFTGASYGPPLREGDVLGCGYRPRTGSVFFTRNGRKLDEAFVGLGLNRSNVFPTVGADNAAVVHVNLGQAGFVFIEANVKKWGLAPMAGTLAPPPAYGNHQVGSILLATGESQAGGVREEDRRRENGGQRRRRRYSGRAGADVRPEERREPTVPAVPSPLRSSSLGQPPTDDDDEEAVEDEDDDDGSDASQDSDPMPHNPVRVHHCIPRQRLRDGRCDAADAEAVGHFVGRVRPRQTSFARDGPVTPTEHGRDALAAIDFCRRHERSGATVVVVGVGEKDGDGTGRGEEEEEEGTGRRVEEGEEGRREHVATGLVRGGDDVGGREEPAWLLRHRPAQMSVRTSSDARSRF